MGLLDGQVALVTGGSKGLGAATALLFAEAGARVVVTFGNDVEAADQLIASLPGIGHRASQTPAQDTRAIESLAASIEATEGRLDILVNNAGSTRVIPHADLRALDDDVLRLRAGGQSAGTIRHGARLPVVARGERAWSCRQCRLGVGGARWRQQHRLCRRQGRASRDDDVAGAGTGAGDPGGGRRA